MNNIINDNLTNDIKKIGEKYPISKIVLFGSRARGEYRYNSDIDLAIFPLPEFANSGYLYSDIDDLNTLLKVDFVLINDNTDTKLRYEIETEGVLIYERTKK